MLNDAIIGALGVIARNVQDHDGIVRDLVRIDDVVTGAQIGGWPSRRSVYGQPPAQARVTT